MSEVDDFLEHYGKKGMRWGVRNNRSSNSEPNRISRNKKLAVGVGLGAAGISAVFIAKQLGSKGKIKVSNIIRDNSDLPKVTSFVSNTFRDTNNRSATDVFRSNGFANEDAFRLAVRRVISDT